MTSSTPRSSGHTAALLIGALLVVLSAWLTVPVVQTWWGNRQLRTVSTAPGGALGELVYVRDDGFWMRDPTSSSPAHLVTFDSNTFATSPSNSPDGSLIAYTLTYLNADQSAGRTDLELMQRDGSAQRVIRSNIAPAQSLAWAPDESALYVTRQNGDHGSQIVRVSLTGTDEEIVLADGNSPTLSADGRLLAFIRFENKGGAASLWVANADGSAARRLTGAPSFQDLLTPKFDPTGQQIAFAGLEGAAPPAAAPAVPEVNLGPQAAFAHGPPYDIWVINADGSQLRQVTTVGDQINFPTWSADGRWIAFTGDPGLFVAASDGKGAWFLDDSALSVGLTWRN